RILRTRNFDEVIKDILGTEEEINTINSTIKEIKVQIERLSQWISYRGKIEDLGTREIYTVKLGRIRCSKYKFEELKDKFFRSNVTLEKIFQDEDFIYLIVAYHNYYRKEAEEFLSKSSFEEADIGGYTGTISQNIDLLTKKVEYNSSRKTRLLAHMRGLAEEYRNPLIVYLDWLENSLDIENAINSGFSTESVSFYTCWVKRENVEKVIRIVQEYRFTRVIEVEPEEGEVIPTLLENRPLFRPFEIVVNLYGVPKHFEIDPTPWLSIFFAAFFGLCVTDAGYGILFCILALIFSFKMKEARNFLRLVFFCGIFTVMAGAVFNGWFGDLPSYLGFDKLFSRLAIFGDPLKSNVGAMNFFRLALLVGVIQVIYGLFIKFFDSLRQKDWGGAFFDSLPWILIVGSMVVLVLSSNVAVSMQLADAPVFPASVSRYLVWLIIPSALVIVLFSAREEKSWMFRLFMGFLRLTIVSGITSYLGDFLSYIRLMALGLVTAGIGVAINKIAFQMLSIPGVGFLAMAVVLIFGHIFNMGINALGGFVHTLRLQYVEFFPKFYIGGGRPFRVLKDKHKYVTILEE
ncbi:MAG: V-type ATP synthase subunit I, partial [Actinobacteria bacterium]|nr:V-type ATP synthase subunit I [Actinomycetota bacterium]